MGNIMGNDLLIWIFLFSMLGILGIFMAIAANRKWKGFRLVILKDLRNPSGGSVRYWALYNSAKDDYVKLYSNLFRPFKNKITPPFDLSAYSYDRTIYALRGVSGHPEDENIIPIHLPLVSAAGATQYSSEASGAVIRTLKLMDRILAKKLRISDVIELDNQSYYVKSIDYNGVTIAYEGEEEIKNKDGTISKHKVEYSQLLDLDRLDELKITIPAKDRELPSYIDFFNTGWVMQTLGVVPVEDVNVVLSSQKSAVASFNSKVNERVLNKQGWFTRNVVLVQVILITMVFAIAFSIIIYATQNYVTSVGNGVTASSASFIQKLVGMGQTTGAIPTVSANAIPAT